MPSNIRNQDTASSLAASIAMLRKLEWQVRHTIESTLAGEYKSSFRGKGMEFDQVVKYEFGDDVRDIDWNVTAKLGEPYRKKFVEEREINLILLFEDTPSLQFGSGERSKREALLELASLLMLLSAVNGDRISLMYASPEGYDYARSANGRGRIMHAAANLIGKPAPDPLGEQEASIPWRYLTKAAPRHSIFVWLGDHSRIQTPDAWKIIRKRYQPVGFRVEDPWERQLPKSGKQAVYDPTTGDLYTLSSSSAAQRDAHQAWNAKRDAFFKSHFPSNADRLTLQAGENALDAVIQLFQNRIRRMSHV
ncbi:MAG: DUF58 domain-containing protein [Verrucomicrobiota bacterium]